MHLRIPPASVRLLLATAAIGLFSTGCAYLHSEASTPRLHSFFKQELSNEFWAEGACFGDINRDGVADVISGPFWYEGPTFKVRHEYAPADHVSKSKRNGAEVTFRGYKGGLGNENEYSANFFAHSADINGDGWTDILILGFPGENSWWFENPGKGVTTHWKRHVALDVTDNESPAGWTSLATVIRKLSAPARGTMGTPLRILRTPQPRSRGIRCHPTRSTTGSPMVSVWVTSMATAVWTCSKGRLVGAAGLAGW